MLVAAGRRVIDFGYGSGDSGDPTEGAVVPRRTASSFVLVALALAPLGCGDTNASKARAQDPTPARTTASARYQSKSFAVPLTVGVDGKVFKTQPTLDSKHLLYWESNATADKKIRFLNPVEVHRNASGPPVDPPTHFLPYLRGLTKRGAELTETGHMTVDGRPATLLTANTPEPLDGTLGCSVRGGDPDTECFGIQPDFTLRIAVIEGSRTPLLAWARFPLGSSAAFERTFETMLRTVRFR
jgi:hypothetical protein